MVTALFLAAVPLVNPTAAQSEPATTGGPATATPATTAPARAAGAGPRVASVGDSIGHSAEPQVRQALGNRYRLRS